jgi:molybdate transport system substrate-binding protein
MAEALRILSTLAVQGAMVGLARRFEKRTGVPLAIEFAPTFLVLAWVTGGDVKPTDVAILTREACDSLAKDHILKQDSVVDLVRSLVGIAVRAGAPKPDIGSVEALRASLVDAQSIVYSRTGASGIFFAQLIQRLGIAEAVNAKATIIPSGFTAEVVACGEAEMAVQQVSELMVVPGIDVVGSLPSELQSPVTFSGAIFAGSQRPDMAGRLLQFLASEEGEGAFRSAGLEPVLTQRQ